MGWLGNGIYDGDGTQSLHYDIIKWAKMRLSPEDISDCVQKKGHILARTL